MTSSPELPASAAPDHGESAPAWQREWGRAIALGLSRCLDVHPAAHAEGQSGALPQPPLWCVPTRSQPLAAAKLAALHAPPGPARRQAQQVSEQCLAHYRRHLNAALGAAPGDDLGGAAACFLAACAQAIEGHAVTPERWLALRRWLQDWAPPQRVGEADVLLQQQEAFERLATLAAALGEWSVQAQRQGASAQASARLTARAWLAQELGVQADALMKTLHWAGIVAAANPSWDGTALPKHRTGQTGGHRLK
jgi:hypothetical protein